MAVFGHLELESIVQIGDKTRLNATKSFYTKGTNPFDQVKISPEVGVALIDVKGSGAAKEWFLDWQYLTAGVKTVQLQVKSGNETTNYYKTITVISETDDKLLSADADLIQYEPDILKWIPAGRDTFLNVHRASQKLILDWLDSIRVWRSDGTKLTKADIKLTDDLNQLSIYLTLELIFMGISNKSDDVFLVKAKEYRAKAEDVKNRGRIQADFNGNGVLDQGESADMRSFRLVRR